MKHAYRTRQSDNKQQWFVEVQEGTAWKICYTAYSESKANGYVAVQEAVDRISANSTSV